MPDIPKGHKVIDTVKDNKGFYRIIERPDGTKYSQTLKLFTEQDNDRKVRAENKSLGQFSTTNIKGNIANAMALTAVGGGATALALHNATQGRQDKVGRKVRGAAFGSTRPQGAGLKTPAGTAGDVRGRVSPNRPPAIVRSVNSFNQRGSTMPQTGDLFSQSAAVRKNAGRRIGGLSSQPTGTFDPVKQRTAGSRSASGQRLVKSPKATSPNTLKLNTRPGNAPGARVDIDKTAKASSSSTSAKGDTRPPLGKDKTRTVLGNSSKKGLQQLTSRLSSDLEAPKINPKTSSSGGSSMAQTKGSVPANVQKAFQQGRGGTGAGRTNIQAVVDKTVGRTQSGATSRPTGSATYSQQAAGRGNAGATPSRGAIATTNNRNPNARASGVPTTNRPGSPPMPSRSSASVGSPGTQIMRPIPESTYRVIPKPSVLGKVNNFLGKLSKVRTGVTQVDAMMQASDMMGKFGDKYTAFKKQYKAPREYNFFDTRRSEDEGNAFRAWEKKQNTAAAPKATTPAVAAPASAASSGKKPYEPTYFPEAGNNGNAVRKPDSYLGEAFDYSLQKGTTSGSKYLEHMFRRDKVSEDDQQRLRERFNKKVVGDQTLKEYGADKGITQTLEGKKSGLGEALLGKYRDTGTYQGNTKYDVMRAAAEARMARK